jgi:hypothetical protein
MENFDFRVKYTIQNRKPRRGGGEIRVEEGKKK